MKVHKFQEYWNSLSLMDRDVLVAELIFGHQISYIKVLEGFGPSADSGKGLDDMVPHSAWIPAVQQEDGSTVYWNPLSSGREYSLHTVPEYTSSPADAWKVIVEMGKREYWYEINSTGVTFWNARTTVSLNHARPGKVLSVPWSTICEAAIITLGKHEPLSAQPAPTRGE